MFVGAGFVSLLCISNQVEAQRWKTTAELSRSFLVSFNDILNSIPPDRDIAVLDGLMYFDGLAVGISSEALALSREILYGQKTNSERKIHVLTRTGLSPEARDPVIVWSARGDTVVGASFNGAGVFLGPAPMRSENRLLYSADGFSVEMLGDYDRFGMASSVMIYPLREMKKNVIVASRKGVFVVCEF